MIFGVASFEKLAELQNIREWMAWLRQEFEKADAQAAEHLRTELARAVPDRHDPGDEKWKICVRLHSPAQSVRTKALKVWNQWPVWIKLYAVDKHPHQLDVEFVFREAVSLQALGAFSYHTARLFLAALNIASFGLWWWRATDHYTQFYERITDLKADPSATPVELIMRRDPKFQWERKALKEADLGRVGMCFGMIAKLNPDQRIRIIEPYLTGLGLLAKSDLYFNMSASACERFTKAVLETMQHFGDWDGTDGALPDAISGAFSQMPEDDRNEWLEIIQQLRGFPPRSEGMTIERAALLKILADAYFINSFSKRAKDESWVVADKE